MIPTKAQLVKIAGGKPDLSNVNSVIVALDKYGEQFGLDKPHRLAHYIAQLAHESGGYRYDQEIASGAAYEGRKDLGNTKRGDGTRFKGRGPIQITGRANYAAFTKWCAAITVADTPDPPDFTATPNAINTDPWEGLAPIWYWSTRKLNELADENNIEQITKAVNGGLNGYPDRIRYYIRAALVLLGYTPADVKGFQTKAGIEVDGDAGPRTRAALHMALAALSAVKATPTAPAVPATPVTASPVVTEVAVDVKTPGKAPADAATGAGVGSGALAVTVNALKDTVSPYASIGSKLAILVVVLAVASAVLTVGGLAWSWYAKRKKAATIAAINSPTVTP